MAKVSKPIITEDKQWFKLECPYEPDFIRDLKDQIPESDRWWDRSQQCWHISIEHLDTTLGLCNGYYATVENRLS